MKHIKPMLATLIDKPFDAKGWLYEIKWDGFRAIAEISRGKVELYSRNMLSFNEHFPPIVKSLKKIKTDMVLDGEVVVVDRFGKSHFQLIQNYLQNQASDHLMYYVFDILFFKGKDLRNLPLVERKKILRKNLPKFANIKLSDDIEEKGAAFFKLAQKKGLEGIVAKDGQSVYHSGKRTRDWLKIKAHQQQEAVIGGFTQPLGSRKYFGSLILGVYERGKFKYIGHSGGGFDQGSLKNIYEKLKKLQQKNSPFEIPPKSKTKSYWVRPKLVCEVAFSEWTTDGQMRHPVFLGLRMDKKPTEVHMERAK